MNGKGIGIDELIAKVCDTMDGRAVLDNEDLHYIHAALCQLWDIKLSKKDDPRDLGLSDDWIHDVDMGAK